MRVIDQAGRINNRNTSDPDLNVTSQSLSISKTVVALVTSISLFGAGTVLAQEPQTHAPSLEPPVSHDSASEASSSGDAVLPGSLGATDVAPEGTLPDEAPHLERVDPKDVSASQKLDASQGTLPDEAPNLFRLETEPKAPQSESSDASSTQPIATQDGDAAE